MLSFDAVARRLADITVRRSVIPKPPLHSQPPDGLIVVGRILNCAVEESALTDGKPDAAKMKPLCFDACQHVYRLMGETVAKAFSCGKELKK